MQQLPGTLLNAPQSIVHDLHVHIFQYTQFEFRLMTNQPVSRLHLTQPPLILSDTGGNIPSHP